MKTIAHQWDPADYACHSQGQERWAKELFALLAPQLQESVLDIGCGDGRNTAELAKLVPAGRVVGVDRSPDMIRFAQEHFPPAQFPNLTFVQADASELPFDAEFDAIFSNAVLHWVLDHRPVLAGVTRSLRPGGRCVLQMGGKGNGDDVVGALEACLQDPKWQAEWRPRESHYGFHGAEEYREWMGHAGLCPDSVELIEKDMVHESRGAFTGWLRTAWHPYTTRVAAERREEFLGGRDGALSGRASGGRGGASARPHDPAAGVGAPAAVKRQGRAPACSRWHPWFEYDDRYTSIHLPPAAYRQAASASAAPSARRRIHTLGCLSSKANGAVFLPVQLAPKAESVLSRW